MFDYIVWRGKAYQTKDLDCLMRQYNIAEDGTLSKAECEYEPVPEEERQARAGVMLFWEKVREAFSPLRVKPGSERMVVVEHDGDIHFYHYCNDISEADDENYRATYRRGKLRELMKWDGEHWEPVEEAKNE